MRKSQAERRQQTEEKFTLLSTSSLLWQESSIEWPLQIQARDYYRRGPLLNRGCSWIEEVCRGSNFSFFRFSFFFREVYSN